MSWDAGVTGGSLLTLQNDGNLILYGTPPSPGAAAPVVWSLGTNTFRGNAPCAGESLQQGQYISCGSDYLIMQSDNNLVLYPQGSASALWATGTEHNEGTSYVIPGGRELRSVHLTFLRSTGPDTGSAAHAGSCSDGAVSALSFHVDGSRLPGCYRGMTCR